MLSRFAAAALFDSFETRCMRCHSLWFSQPVIDRGLAAVPLDEGIWLHLRNAAATRTVVPDLHFPAGWTVLNCRILARLGFCAAGEFADWSSPVTGRHGPREFVTKRSAQCHRAAADPFSARS